MRRRVIRSELAPAAIGPYSQAIVIDGWVHVSGQIALDPATGQLVGTDAAAQTHRVLDNLKAVLEAADCTLDDVVKTTVYLVDLDDFAAVNEVYARYFTQTPPARACIQAARLPRGARVEIDVIARR